MAKKRPKIPDFPKEIPKWPKFLKVAKNHEMYHCFTEAQI